MNQKLFKKLAHIGDAFLLLPPFTKRRIDLDQFLLEIE